MRVSTDCDRHTFTKAAVVGGAALATSGLPAVASAAEKATDDLVVTTVCGDIAPEELGYTSMHEHTILDGVLGVRRMAAGMESPLPPEKLTIEPDNYRTLLDGGMLFCEDTYRYNDVDGMAKEVAAFQELGGQTIVDASGMGLRGDVSLVRQVAENTSVNIVCCTGVYTWITWPEEIMGLTEDQLFDLFMDEIENGIGDTGVKPGFVKHAFMSNSGSPEIFARETEAFRACVRAAVASGLSLQVHTVANAPYHEDSLALVDMAIDGLGMDPGKLVMLHMPSWVYAGLTASRYATDPDTTKIVDPVYALDLLDRGVVVSVDGWGIPLDSAASIMPDDKDRLKLLCTLLDRGYQDQLVLGNDCIGAKITGLEAGQYGFTRFSSFAVPQLEALGYGPDVIDALLIHNPVRILAH